MVSLAYVILPVTGTPPGEAIRAWLAPFQRGGRGDLPETRLAFHDETDELRQAHEAHFTFIVLEKGGLQIEGGADVFHLDMQQVRDEMKRLGHGAGLCGSRTRWISRLSSTGSSGGWSGIRTRGTSEDG